MIRIIQGFTLADSAAASMFEDRKRLFVDLFGWDVPVVDNRFEVDEFDGPDATYVVATDESGDHSGSLRLLPTAGPHILADLFSSLCDKGVPRGASIVEVTRLCLPVRLGARGRLSVRNRLISAMTDHALSAGITSLTGVVSWDFLEQVMSMGWRCVPLGRPRLMSGRLLGAFRIDLDTASPALLATRGIYVPDTVAAPVARQAA